MQDIQQLLIPYEEMLKAGMHFGRRKTVYNPGMSKYVFTVRDGICIIDLLKTQDSIKEVANFLKEVKKNNGLILFTSLTKQSTQSTKELAEALGMPYVIDRWLGGTLTNFKVIAARVKRLEEMEKQKEANQLDKYTKKERLMFERDLQKMKTRFDGLKKLTRMPDVVFTTSLKESALPIKEAKLMGVKVVSIANTDSNPGNADYIIPANDRSKKAIDLIIDVLKKELQNG